MKGAKPYFVDGILGDILGLLFGISYKDRGFHEAYKRKGIRKV
jgi:hypothetical protein